FREKINVESLVAQIKQLVEETYNTSNQVELVVEHPKININMAPLEELILLPGIGKALANKIIDMREHKKFESFDELQRIHKYLNCNKLKDRIIFS
ncbi:DUF655 domain-containing protein, partial [Candidatus Woesearchaeota archaeon]|nr:DUF655 domain-containing protein [Candidatus Woesearchaeota archaeon]